MECLLEAENTHTEMEIQHQLLRMNSLKNQKKYLFKTKQMGLTIKSDILKVKRPFRTMFKVIAMDWIYAQACQYNRLEKMESGNIQSTIILHRLIQKDMIFLKLNSMIIRGIWQKTKRNISINGPNLDSFKFKTGWIILF